MMCDGSGKTIKKKKFSHLDVAIRKFAFLLPEI